ncbi:CPBP family intramembrane metalloprotease [Flavobacterium tructae]
MIKTFFEDFKNIFKSPDLICCDNKSFKFKGFISYFLIIQLFFFAISFLTFIIANKYKLIIHFDSHKFFFINVVIIAPLKEELLLRSFLRKSMINIALFLSMLTCFFLDHTIDDKFIICLVSFSSFPIYHFLLRFRIKKSYFLKPYSRNQLLVLVYLSSILFGLAHIVNFQFDIHQLSIKLFFLLIIVSLPKIFGAFLFAIYRIKFGLLQSFLLHAFTNLLGYYLINLSKKTFKKTNPWKKQILKTIS